MAIFTDEEIETIREICQLRPPEVANLTDLLTALNTAQGEACRSDIKQWNRIRYGTAAVHGGIKGTDYDVEADRSLVTNRLRQRLDLSQLSSVISSNSLGSFKYDVGSWIG